MTKEDLTVYYDGACPLCRREIEYYRTRSEYVSFQDISEAPEGSLGKDLTTEEALKRFHVRDGDGQLLSGAAAFSRLWLQTPRLRWVGKIVSRQPVRSIAEAAYRGFLKIRPLMQLFARRTIGN